MLYIHLHVVGHSCLQPQRPMSAVRKEEKEIEDAIKTLETEKSKKLDDKIDEESLTQYGFCIRYLCERETGT